MPWKKSEPMDQKKRVCIEGAGNAEFSGVVPRVWNQPQDGLQMARKVFTPGAGRAGGRFAATTKQPQAIERRASVRNGETQASASALGPAQDPDVVPSATRAGDGER